MAAAGVSVPRIAGAEAPSRLYSLRETTWIQSKAGGGERLGYLGLGASVALRHPGREPGPACPDGYYAIEPRGYVCANDRVTTLKTDPTLQALLPLVPDEKKLPYRYAISNGTPMYWRLPTPEEQERAERWLGAPGSFKRYSWNERHERLAELVSPAPTEEPPSSLRYEHVASGRPARDPVKRAIPLGSTLSFSRVFSHDGRAFLLSADGTLVPADRVRPFRASKFQGVVLAKEQTLPLAWIRQASAPKWVLSRPQREPVQAGAWPRHSAVFLDQSAPAKESGGRTLLPTLSKDARGATLYLDQRDATVVERAERLPAGVGATDKWIQVSVTRGVLVAYRGATPVFTTLISPGLGGPSREGVDPVRASTTPSGTFHIQYKYRVQTMSPQKNRPTDERTFWMSDVPYAQYFSIPFALHTAYWHEDFGEPMSGGCVNLSPSDGKWLFEFTDPPLPEGWTAVWAEGENGRGTLLLITR